MGGVGTLCAIAHYRAALFNFKNKTENRQDGSRASLRVTTRFRHSGLPSDNAQHAVNYSQVTTRAQFLLTFCKENAFGYDNAMVPSIFKNVFNNMKMSPLSQLILCLPFLENKNLSSFQEDSNSFLTYWCSLCSENAENDQGRLAHLSCKKTNL